MMKTNNVVSFPRQIKRGRKRAASYVHTSGGDLALMLLSRDNKIVPNGIERFLLIRDQRIHDIDNGQLALMLSHLIFSQMSKKAKYKMREMVRLMAFDNRPESNARLIAVGLQRIIGH